MVEKILEALWRIDQYTEAYYNLKTEEIVFQNDFFPETIEETESDEFVRLPTQREIDEYSMMQAFALQQEEKPRICLTECLRKKGPYRRFKEMVARLGLQKDWYKYRDEQYLEIARNWCEKYNLITSDNDAIEQEKKQKEEIREDIFVGKLQADNSELLDGSSVIGELKSKYVK